MRREWHTADAPGRRCGLELFEFSQAYAHHVLCGRLAAHVSGDGRDELLPLENKQADVRTGGDGGDPRYVLEQRDLSEELSGLERRHGPAVVDDVHFSLLDEVEAVA